jgi:hypothetical protein
MVKGTAGLGPENYCAGKGHHQLQTRDLFSRPRGCCVRTMTAKGSVGKILLIVSLKGLVAKTN